MDSPTLTSGLLRIRERPGIRADVGFSPDYISCRGAATIVQRHTCPVVRDTALLNRAGQTAMNVLLLSMPDYFEHMRPVAIRMPNGALMSLAGTVDPHLRVAVAELILSHR